MQFFEKFLVFENKYLFLQHNFIFWIIQNGDKSDFLRKPKCTILLTITKKIKISIRHLAPSGYYQKSKNTIFRKNPGIFLICIFTTQFYHFGAKHLNQFFSGLRYFSKRFFGFWKKRNHAFVLWNFKNFG